MQTDTGVFPSPLMPKVRHGWVGLPVWKDIVMNIFKRMSLAVKLA